MRRRLCSFGLGSIPHSNRFQHSANMEPTRPDTTQYEVGQYKFLWKLDFRRAKKIGVTFVVYGLEKFLSGVGIQERRKRRLK